MTSEELAAAYQKIAAENPLHTRREIAYMLINRRIVKDCTLKGLESRLSKIGINGNRKAVQADLAARVCVRFQTEFKGGNRRNFCRKLAADFGVDFRRVENILYRNGYCGNYKEKETKTDTVATATDRGRAWIYGNNYYETFKNGLFMKFSPAWYGKNL